MAGRAAGSWDLDAEAGVGHAVHLLHVALLSVGGPPATWPAGCSMVTRDGRTSPARPNWRETRQGLVDERDVDRVQCLVHDGCAPNWLRTPIPAVALSYAFRTVLRLASKVRSSRTSDSK